MTILLLVTADHCSQAHGMSERSIYCLEFHPWNCLGIQIPKVSLEELKSLLKKVKEESEKADLKLNSQKTKIMASGPITSW